MSSLNLIGGEKGGVGKSVVARLLAQYFIDTGRAFTGFDTDRSHASFRRFYADYASPVVIDSEESLDTIAEVLDPAGDEGPRGHVLVDLASQTAQPLARWMASSDLLAVMGELNVKVNLWHVADSGKESVALLQALIDTYGTGPNYIVVRNLGRGSDFSSLDDSVALQSALRAGAQVISLPLLQESSMRKIDRQDASFWAAINTRQGPHALGLLERQRVKNWLKAAYASFDTLPLD